MKRMATVPTNVILGLSMDHHPKRDFFFYVNFDKYAVRKYVEKPTRCYKCQNYGHIASKCQRPTRCQRCGLGNPTAEYQPDTSTVSQRCLHCQGDHPTGDKACPKYKLECKVVQLHKTNKMSYSEAVKSVNSNKQHTAKETKTSTPMTTKDTRQAADTAGDAISVRELVIRLTSPLTILIEV